MKITEKQLRNIISESVKRTLKEDYWDTWPNNPVNQKDEPWGEGYSLGYFLLYKDGNNVDVYDNDDIYGISDSVSGVQKQIELVKENPSLFIARIVGRWEYSDDNEYSDYDLSEPEQTFYSACHENGDAWIDNSMTKVIYYGSGMQLSEAENLTKKFINEFDTELIVWMCDNSFCSIDYNASTKISNVINEVESSININ